jgi:hypothetical protein
VKLRQATTTILFSAATLLAPSALSAQFTTFVAPPQKQSAGTIAKPTVATAKAKADSVRRMTLTDMKAWVDSAAGTSTQLAAVNDTTTAMSNPAAPLPSKPGPEHRTTAFSNGAVAPSTATALPTYLVAGLIMFAVGLVTLRRQRQTSSR